MKAETSTKTKVPTVESVAVKPKVELIEDSAEVLSYIQQQILEFKPFVTAKTVISVTAKNPMKLKDSLESNGKTVDPKRLKKMHRISIMLEEDGGSLQAEALHENIYVAIFNAREKIMKKLVKIQESVETNQERQVQINHFLQSTLVH
ncbi:MAG: hypothetical protein ACOYOK_07475 [Pseudobdellovibrionaceae bacterium]